MSGVSWRLIMLTVGAVASSIGCGGVVDDDATAADELNSLRLANAIYIAQAETRTPAHDFLPAMSVGIDAKRPVGATPANSVRYLYDYSGSPSRVTGACLGTWKVARSTLTLECSDPTIYTFKIVKNDPKTLVLMNDDGESFTLDRIDPEARRDLRAECTGTAFKLRIDVAKTDTRRRVVFHVTPIANAFQGQYPQGIFVLDGVARGEQLEVKGTDFYDGDVAVTMPADPAGAFSASLRYSDDGGPFVMPPETHRLSCRVVP